MSNFIYYEKLQDYEEQVRKAKEYDKLQQELQRKDNIINELKKWCNKCIENHIIARKNGDITISDTFFEIVLDKIEELENE